MSFESFNEFNFLCNNTCKNWKSTFRDAWYWLQWFVYSFDTFCCIIELNANTGENRKHLTSKQLTQVKHIFIKIKKKIFNLNQFFHENLKLAKKMCELWRRLENCWSQHHTNRIRFHRLERNEFNYILSKARRK